MRLILIVFLISISSGTQAVENSCGDDVEALTKLVVLSLGAPRNDSTIQLNISAPKEMNSKKFSTLFIQRGTFAAPLKEYEAEDSIYSLLVGTRTELGEIVIAFTYGDGGCRVNINVPAKV